MAASASSAVSIVTKPNPLELTRMWVNTFLEGKNGKYPKPLLLQDRVISKDYNVRGSPNPL